MTTTGRASLLALLASTALAPLVAIAQQPAPPPVKHTEFLTGLKPYVPRHQVSGTIRNYGNNYIPGLMKLWEDGFAKLQPGIKFTTNLPGTEASIAGLDSGIADISFIGREGYRSEIRGFRGRFGYDPLGVEISSGSFATPHKTFSLEVFVHKSNPIPGLTMAQAERVFGCGGSAGKPARTWADLGVTGPFASHPIHVYGYQFDTGMAGYFNRVVLHDSGTWNAALKDFDNGRDPRGEVINAGVYILQALAKDPDGIAFANVMYGNAGTRPLGLARTPGAPFVQATPESVFRRDYPIHRFTTLYINRKPGQPIDPKIEEFIRYILSKDGMAAVVEDGAYLPLNEKVIEQQLKKLD